MSKKAPVKKSRRRLKRSVRRSFAAVLMITAIAVAAIPVPENYAAPEESIESRAEQKKDAHAEAAKGHKYQETGTYAVLDENGEKQYETDASGNEILKTETNLSKDIHDDEYDYFDLSKYAGKSVDELVET